MMGRPEPRLFRSRWEARTPTSRRPTTPLRTATTCVCGSRRDSWSEEAGAASTIRTRGYVRKRKREHEKGNEVGRRSIPGAEAPNGMFTADFFVQMHLDKGDRNKKKDRDRPSGYTACQSLPAKSAEKGSYFFLPEYGIKISLDEPVAWLFFGGEVVHGTTEPSSESWSVHAASAGPERHADTESRWRENPPFSRRRRFRYDEKRNVARRSACRSLGGGVWRRCERHHRARSAPRGARETAVPGVRVRSVQGQDEKFQGRKISELYVCDQCTARRCVTSFSMMFLI